MMRTGSLPARRRVELIRLAQRQGQSPWQNFPRSSESAGSLEQIDILVTDDFSNGLFRGVDPILRILFHSAGWRVGDKAIGFLCRSENFSGLPVESDGFCALCSAVDSEKNLAPSVIASKPECPKGFASRVPPSEAPFPNGQTRRLRIGIAADFRAQAESLHAQFQSALLARD
jgi:hypothetical protein